MLAYFSRSIYDYAGGQVKGIFQGSVQVAANGFCYNLPMYEDSEKIKVHMYTNCVFTMMLSN